MRHLFAIAVGLLIAADAFVQPSKNLRTLTLRMQSSSSASSNSKEGKSVVVIGAGWGGLSTAHALRRHDPSLQVTVVDAAPRAGGLVGDGYLTPGGRRAEAGIHGFWNNYFNIFKLLDELELPEDPLTGYAEQGQWSPGGLEAVWPVYRRQPQLPTGLGQALFTKFLNLSPLDRLTAAPLILAFSEFDDSDEAWRRFDKLSFRDLCVKLGVSKRMYDEAFEPMILTGLFAPGEQCSAAAALGMAYFFVLKDQRAFDVRWCRGNIGEKIFQPWVKAMEARGGGGGGGGVEFRQSCRAVGFSVDPASHRILEVQCEQRGSDSSDGSGSNTAAATATTGRVLGRRRRWTRPRKQRQQRRRGR